MMELAGPAKTALLVGAGGYATLTRFGAATMAEQQRMTRAYWAGGVAPHLATEAKNLNRAGFAGSPAHGVGLQA